MPGITSRTALFGRLRNGRLRRLEFNLVNTDLGAMLEPNSAIPGFGVGAGVVSVVGDTSIEDYPDNVFDDVKIVNEDEILSLINTSGLQVPRLY